MFSKQDIKNISRIGLCILFILFNTYSSKTYGQAGTDLPIIEDFETSSVWPWYPWVRWTNNSKSCKTKGSAHSGNFGLNCQDDFIAPTNKQIGLTGQAISWWVRFQSNTEAYCGFGNDSSEHTYYLCVDPRMNTLHFQKSPDYTYPPLKAVKQIYKLNVWYRAEIAFNTTTNVTGKLYASDGSKLLNSTTLEIPDLAPGGICFRGFAVHLDDIRGGTRSKRAIADTNFAPKLGEPLILKNIVFESNKSNLFEQSFVELDRLVVYLKCNSTYKITIVGHTDNIGKEDNNKNLSEARAKAVADYLIKSGINKANINHIGFGSLKPIMTNSTEEGRQKNRRVEIIISAN